MRYIHFFTLIIGIILAAACATPGGLPAAKLGSKINIERYMEKATIEDHFSGVVMVAHHGKILLNQGYGMATEKAENKPNTIMHVASVTKQFTAAAIMLLSEAGKIDLSASINRYLPKKYQSEKWENVTVHHLLSHTSGISDYAVHRDYYDVRKGFCYGSTIDGMIHEARTKDLEFVPGSTFNYSNIGYTLLGVIIEQACGCSYGEFIKQKLLIPAKMFSSGIHEENHIEKKDEAKGYRWDEGKQKLVEDDEISLPVTAPDGGLYTTTEDLYRWSKVISGKTPGILSPEIISKMTAVVRVSAPPRDGPWAHYGKNGNGYGYGLFIEKFPRISIQHPGYIVGFRSQVNLFPEEGIFIAVLANNTKANPSKIANDIAKIVLEGIQGK